MCTPVERARKVSQDKHHARSPMVTPGDNDDDGSSDSSSDGQRMDLYNKSLRLKFGNLGIYLDFVNVFLSLTFYFTDNIENSAIDDLPLKGQYGWT